MNKCEFEYVINTSQRILYNMISTAAGLAEWFADNVNIKKNIYIFKWKDSIERAELIHKKDNASIRFRWIDSDDDNQYFEFRLEKDQLTGDVALIVTDFDDDEEELKELWNSQIAKLKHVLGL